MVCVCVCVCVCDCLSVQRHVNLGVGTRGARQECEYKGATCFIRKRGRKKRRDKYRHTRKQEQQRMVDMEGRRGANACCLPVDKTQLHILISNEANKKNKKQNKVHKRIKETQEAMYTGDISFSLPFPSFFLFFSVFGTLADQLHSFSCYSSVSRREA